MLLISQESKICYFWQDQGIYRPSFLLISKWGYFLPDIYWASVGIRQVVLGSKLFKADRKIRLGQLYFPQRACSSAGRTLGGCSPTLQSQVAGDPHADPRWAWHLWAPGTKAEPGRPTWLPGTFWSGTRLSPFTMMTTGPGQGATGHQGASRQNDSSFYLSQTLSSAQ